MNDSSTGGPLLPDPNGPQPLEGAALNAFLQGWIVGISGIDPTLVRPRWQAEGANIPDAGTAWMAFGIRRRPNDTYTFSRHDGSLDNGKGADIQLRNETLDLLVSCYDLGIGGEADNYISVLKDGLQVNQNLELLILNGYNFIEASEPVTAPSLFKERWKYRVDLAMIVKRQTARQYPIRNVAGAVITVKTDSGYIVNAGTVIPNG